MKNKQGPVCTPPFPEKASSQICLSLCHRLQPGKSSLCLGLEKESWPPLQTCAPVFTWRLAETTGYVPLFSWQPLPHSYGNSSYKDESAKLFLEGGGDVREDSHQLWMGEFRLDSGEKLFIWRVLQHGKHHLGGRSLLAWSSQASAR